MITVEGPKNSNCFHGEMAETNERPTSHLHVIVGKRVREVLRHGLKVRH